MAKIVDQFIAGEEDKPTCKKTAEGTKNALGNFSVF